MKKKFILKEETVISLFTKNEEYFENDDCASLPGEKEGIAIVTSDSLVENTHFKIEWHPPELLAKKAFHVNFSDILASGGKPAWCMVQIGIPGNLHDEYLKKFIISFKKECKRFGCSIIGGDTFASGIFIIAITMGGMAKKHILRKATPGSLIYVTGELGLSQLGLKILSGEVSVPAKLQKKALRKHLAPEAKYRIIDTILHHAEAMMDISDGLYQDLEKMARVTGYEFHIEVERIPVPSAYREYIPLEDALTSGEEYELLFTSKEELSYPFVTKIGKVTHKKIKSSIAPVKFYFQGKEFLLQKKGYEHF